MPLKIDTRISPALHPTNVTAIEGYGQDVASVLEPTERAFELAYREIGRVLKAREAARADPTLNEAAQVLKTDDLASTVLPKLTREFDSVRVNLERGIVHIEKELSAPIEAKAVASMAEEIRRHVKALPSNERLSFVRSAIERGDERTVSSVLGGPSYLSGLEREMAETLLRDWHVKAQPALAKRLSVMRAAKELIETNAPRVFPTLEKAVGHVEVKSPEGLVIRRISPAELRKQRDQSNKAFAAPAAA